jgi:hypothetical protein
LIEDPLPMLLDERDTDFTKLAVELRDASVEALREASLDPVNREWLERKAYDLERAAARIEEEADNRAGSVTFIDERD